MPKGITVKKTLAQQQKCAAKRQRHKHNEATAEHVRKYRNKTIRRYNQCLHITRRASIKIPNDPCNMYRGVWECPEYVVDLDPDNEYSTHMNHD